MTRIRLLLILLLSALMLFGCAAPVLSAAKLTVIPAPELKLSKSAALEEPMPGEEGFREGMTELYPLNDVFLSNCMEGVENFSVTILPEAWAGMSLEDLTMTVYQIGKRWCVEYFRVYPTPQADGSVWFHIFGAKPRDGVRMSFEIGMTDSDWQCLDAIYAVVDGFRSEYSDDQILVETAIYDWICDHMEYHSFDEFPDGDPRQEQCTSAINAFREGWGNCQAYSDLFYIMASRAGLQPGYISGYAGGWHLWNFVCLYEGLSDVKNVMVDVTFGDSTQSHYYLNFGLDRAVDRSWYEDLWAYGFEETTDDFCSYYGLYSMDYGLSAETYEEAATFFVWKGLHGYNTAEVLMKGVYQVNSDQLNTAIYKAMEKDGLYRTGNYLTIPMQNGDVIIKVIWGEFYQ